MSTAKVTETEVRDILADHAKVDGLTVRITRQLDRHEYVAVNKVLEALGGTWNRKAGAHLFPADPAAALAAFVGGGDAPLPARTAEGYVATPADLAVSVVRDFTGVEDLPAGSVVLEPSAGDGALVRAILSANPAVSVVAVEPNRDRLLVVEGVSVYCATFETVAAEWTGAAAFDAVVMNPPFAMPGQPTVWIDHVRLAWELLAPGGRLTAIVPGGFGFRTDRRHQVIRELVDGYGGSAPLPEEAFKASGTGIRTAVIWLDRPAVGGGDRG